MALFVALGGTGYAALTITGKSVKDASLTGRDIKNNSVRTADVAGLLATDFKAGQLRAGAQGPTGPQGPQGAQGPKGDKEDPGDPAAAGPGRANPNGSCDPGASTTYVSCTSVDLTISAAGRVLLVADAQWTQQTGTASGRCRFTGPGTSNNQVEPGGSGNQGAVGVNEVTTPLAAGTHTFGVECREFAGNTISFSDYMISAVYVGDS